MFDVGDNVIDLVVPVVLFGSWVVPAVFSRWTKYKLRLAEINTTRTSGKSVSVDIAALRAEIEAMRATTTEYDLSLEKTLTELRRRIDFLEASRSSERVYADYQPKTSADEEEQSNIALGS
jgi:hypothetical protein